MKKTEQLFHELKRNRLIALLTPGSAEECLEAYELFHKHGITLEIALRSGHALAGIGLIAGKHHDALILAGTVMTARQAGEAIDAGAAGIVSADFIPEVVELCAERDIMCIPGGLSDAGKQLVLKAAVYGCTLEELKKDRPYQWIYKLFPAFSGATSNVGLSGAWRGPFGGLVVVYTGGVSLGTLPGAVRADREGIFCASALTKYLDDRQKTEDEIARWKAVLEGGGTTEAGPPPPAPEPAAVEGKGEPGAVPAGVVTFGELMLRLSPPSGVRLQAAEGFALHFGGAAANVSVSLARFGLDAAFVSAFPQNDLGDNALRTLRGHGVDTGHIVRRGSRMGIYYLEHGSGPRPSKVVYDRAHSAFSGIEPRDLDWDRILEGKRWFHWTGISPALGENVTATLKEGLEAAREKGVTVSADLNYRSRLWSEERAGEVMSELMPYVDLLIANEEDPSKVFGIDPPDTDVEAGELNVEGYAGVAEQLIERFAFGRVAITLRESISASENRWSACLHDGQHFYTSAVHHVWIVDRVGAGDAFAAGLIYGIVSGKEDHEALNFGVAASCLKHSIVGDFNLVDASEVERLASGHASGRVIR